MLSITNFFKKYPGGAVPVLSISECILKEGIYWIKGENGSGKTSLMKSIAGIIPFDGAIAVNDLHMHKNRMEYAKIVNYAEAEPVYPPFLSGKELIDFYRSAKGGDFPGQLVKDLGADHFLHQKTVTYSSGMLKKLSLVLAFIGSPKLILLDEPLIALDTAAVEVLQSTIMEYHKNGVSFLITSHQLLNNHLLKDSATLLIKDQKLQKEIK